MRGALSPEAGITLEGVFGRRREAAEIADWLGARRSFVFWGSEGVGKSFLLKALLPGLPQALYCPAAATRGGVLTHLFGLLEGHPPNGLAARGVRGRVMMALSRGEHLVVLDHLCRPSRIFANDIRDILHLKHTPVVAVARSAHMEELGDLYTLYPDRRERYELRNFDAATAGAFIDRLIAARPLDACNLEEFRDRALRASAGNPGALERMVDLAGESRYRSGEQIMFGPLYIDYCLGPAASRAARQRSHGR